MTSEWQPIETAPKYGQWVIVAVKKEYPFPYMVGGAKYIDGAWWFGDNAPMDGSGPFYPSHWQPFPEPPE